MNLGGNARFLTLLSEYKISLKEPNIEYKYQTVISLYYCKLLDVQVCKIEKVKGADEEYNKLLEEKPSYEFGTQLSQAFIINEGVINDNEKKENDGKYKTDSALGGWFGYFDDKINNVSEFIGLNAVINNAKNGFNKWMDRFGIKDSLNKAVDYSKSAGEYVVDKAKKVSQTPLIVEAKEKISLVVDEVKDSAINMIKNNSGNNQNTINNREIQNNNT